MSVPGLPNSALSSGSLVYGADINDVDLWVDAGSPATDVDIDVIVAAGVLIGSTSSASPAMDATGFTAGSTITLLNEGRIQGKGGDGGRGGDGISNGSPGTTLGGGGGGGAGTAVGAGGVATSTATPGDPGTATDGGAAGSNDTVGSASYVPATAGGTGGDALDTGSISITIDNGSGEIWGGGAGGGGGVDPTGATPPLAPTAGAAPGVGTASFVGGVVFGGNAVRGTASTFSSGGSSPNVEGDVGA